jgi:hypothetical protein
MITRHFRTPVLGLLLLFAPFLSACFANLHQDRLSVALLDQPYSEQFQIDSSWDFMEFWNSYFTVADDGELPAGLGVTSGGEIVGSPQEVGHFDFHVSLYSYDPSIWGDSSSGYEDGEWFTVFVTEPSTNADCPSPDDATLTDLFICAGQLSTDYLEEGDGFYLDINYYANYATSVNDDVATLDFTIGFDPDAFAPYENGLNSSVLRETATHFGSTVAFDEPSPGQLHVVVTAQTEQLRLPGRLMDLPLVAVQDLPAGIYDFTVTFNGIEQGADAKTTPSLVEIDGGLELTDDAPSIVAAAAAADDAATDETTDPADDAATDTTDDATTDAGL